MAKQSGILFFEGNMGGVNYYKTANGYFARKKGGVSKARIMKDPNYENTRKNMEEFKSAAAEGKRIRNLFLPVIERSADSTFSSRFFTQLLKIIKSDPVHPPGSRKLGHGDWKLLEGMELNKHRRFRKLWPREISVKDTGSEFAVEFGQIAYENLDCPSSTTHITIYLDAISVDVEGGDKDSISRVCRQLEVTETLPGGKLVVDKQIIPGTRQIYILSIEYFQLMAGTFYPFRSKLYKAAKVVFAE